MMTECVGRAMRRIGPALMAIALAAVPLCAQERPALPDRLHGETRQAIRRLADSLAAAGVPAEPLFDKAAEGVLKGADDARILRAVRAHGAELSAARLALGPAATPAEVVAGASALHAGVPDDQLRRIARARSPESGLAAPLTVLADLVTRRVPPAVAVSSVEALVARGASDDAFARLRADVQRDILSGLAPATAATARTRALVQATGRREPSRP